MTRPSPRFVTLLCALALLLLGHGPAWGAILNPGDGAVLSGVSLGDRPDLDGILVLETPRPFQITAVDGGIFSGTLLDRVLLDKNGGLVFQTRIADTVAIAPATGGPAPTLWVVTHGGFETSVTSLTEVEYLSDSPGSVGPSQTLRNPPPGYLVGFWFDTPIAGGEASHTFFVRTDAPTFNARGLYQLALSDGRAISMSGYQPDIPEPATALLLGVAALAMGRGRPRRK